MSSSSNQDFAIFTEATRLPASERAAYLKAACGDDRDLRRRVDALLEGYEQVGDFLEDSSPAALIRSRPGHAAGELPTDRIGHFRLLEQIGEGGCGVVYMAEQEEPVRRRVALKVIKPGMDSKSVIARFEAERQVLALMDHPSIAKIFDAGTTEAGRPYFVMELVRGIKITEFCDRHSLTTAARLELFVQVCHAVQHAHQKGIIHRDIKPSNILVTTTVENTALPVVIDFGIAKATTNQRLTDKTLFTGFEVLVGTPAYMRPEQADLTSADHDTRTQIYSLGVLLYELLTGSTPFNTRELMDAGLDEIRRIIRHQEADRPSTRLKKLTDTDLTIVAHHRQSEPPILIRSVSGDLDWIVMKALEKDRTRRYATANGLAVEVQRFLAGETVTARPPSKLYKLQKLVLRNKLLFTFLGVVALLLIASLIIVSASLAKERRSRLEAEAASAKSRQVTKFLEDMLQGVGPSVALGQDTKMLRGILDRTAERVGQELGNQPLVEAELRSLIGTLYRRIGNFSRSEEMHHAALAINRRMFGSNSLEVAASLNELGLSLMSENKLAEAEVAGREALTIRRKLLGNGHADTATSLNDLGAVYRETGRLAEAEPMAREALEIRQKLFGRESLEAADSLRNLCITLGNRGKWVESEAIAREVLAIRLKLLPKEHPWLASSMDDIAWAIGAQGRLDEAETLQRDALAMRRKLLPEEHPNVIESLGLVGDTMRKRGNLQESYSVLSAALALQRKVLGGDDKQTLYTMIRMGLTLEAERKWSEAEPLYREALTAWQRLLGEDDPQTLYTMHRLALALEGQRKWPEAEAAHREALAIWRKKAGPEDPQSLYALRNLAGTYEARGKWAEMEALCREELAAWRRLPGNNDEHLIFTLQKLSSALEGRKKWTEAEAASREALAIIRKRDGNDDPKTLHAVHRLGLTLESQGKWTEAESLHRDALASWRLREGNDHPVTLYAMRNLATSLAGQGKWPEVEKLQRDELASWLKQFQGENQQTFYARRKLGATLESQSKWADAEVVYRQSLELARRQGGNEDPEAVADVERLARVLTMQKKFAEAERAFAEVLTPTFVKQKESEKLILQRLNMMGRRGLWKDAAIDATYALALQPDDHYRYHTLAALLAISKDRPAYEQLCDRLVSKFANTTDPYVGERMAQDALLLPYSRVNFELVGKLAEVALTFGNDTSAMAYSQGGKAMLHYRQGRFSDAVEWAQKALTHPAAGSGAKAKAYAVSALANFQLGKIDEARSMLSKGDSLAPAIPASRVDVDLGESWVAWLMARISLDEAASLIRATKTSSVKAERP